MKRAHAALKNAPGISHRTLLKILNDDPAAEAHEHLDRNILTKELDRVTQVYTPYGPVIDFMELPLEDGATHSWCHVNPFALLWEMCKRSAGFRAIMEKEYKNACDEVRTLAFYSDEATPGNQLRPDNKNQIQCLYWAMLFLPHWLRRRMHGWLPFALMRGVTQAKIVGKLSHIWSRALQRFFSPDGFNFAVGMRLPCACTNEYYFMKLTCGPMIQDLVAHQKSFGTKGACGTRCCTKCEAVLNIEVDRLPDSTDFVHYSTAKPEQWGHHTRDSFFATADVLALVHGKVSKNKFQKLEQALGLHYVPNGLVWNMGLRRHFCPVENQYEDWLHCLFASKGSAAWEIAGFVGTLEKVLKGIPYFKGKPAGQVLDDFARLIHWQNNIKLIPRDFFSTRASSDDAVFKGFAVELMAAVKVLARFSVAVLLPAQKMQAHCKCMLTLSVITEMLETGDSVVPHVARLRQLIYSHREQVVDVYGADIAKPKLHSQQHVPDCIEKWKRNLDVRPMEWKHQIVKTMATNQLSRSALEAAALKRMVYQLLEDSVDMWFLPNCLVQAKVMEACDELIQCLAPYVQIIGGLRRSTTMHTTVGLVKAGAIVSLSHGRLGKACVFVGAREAASQQEQCFIIFHPHSQIGRGGGWRQHEWLELAPADDIVSNLSFTIEGSLVIPHIPNHGI